MPDKIRWGIIGTGAISTKFATGLSVIPEAELVAVGSRSLESANEFGDKFDVPRRYASYEALAADPEIDVVYIGTPHPFHKENSLLCLEAGKAVLCEKPFTLSAAEAEEVVALARSKKLFLMEAMWTRFIPLVVKVRQMLAEGVIGEHHEGAYKSVYAGKKHIMQASYLEIWLRIVLALRGAGVPSWAVHRIIDFALHRWVRKCIDKPWLAPAAFVAYRIARSLYRNLLYKPFVRPLASLRNRRRKRRFPSPKVKREASRHAA